MRSIPGLLQGDLIRISSKLTPDVAKATISLLSGADAYALSLEILQTQAILFRDNVPEKFRLSL